MLIASIARHRYPPTHTQNGTSKARFVGALSTLPQSLHCAAHGILLPSPSPALRRTLPNASTLMRRPRYPSHPKILRIILETTSILITKTSRLTDDRPSNSAASMILECRPSESFSSKPFMPAPSTITRSYRSTPRLDTGNRLSRWLLRRCEGECQ